MRERKSQKMLDKSKPAFSSDYQRETLPPVALVEGEILVQNRFVCLSMMVGLVHTDALGDSLLNVGTTVFLVNIGK